MQYSEKSNLFNTGCQSTAYSL